MCGIPNEVAIPVRAALRRPIDIARLEERALLRTQPEIELSRENHAELFVLHVRGIRGRAFALSDTPEAQHYVVAGEDLASESRHDLLEAVIVGPPHVIR